MPYMGNVTKCTAKVQWLSAVVACSGIGAIMNALLRGWVFSRIWDILFVACTC